MKCEFTTLLFAAAREMINSISEKGNGHGPEQDVIALALDIMFNHESCFIDRCGYQTLRLHASRDPIPRRILFLRAAGTLVILHLILFGVGGRPVSPFLHLYLLGGRDAFQLDMTFLSTTLSGEPLRAIQDWLLLSPSDPLWTGLPHLSPMYNRFIDSGMDVSTFCEPSL
jgi:hypothetical protein